MSDQKNSRSTPDLPRRGLRLVKGGKDTAPSHDAANEQAPKKRPVNPLARQLAALSDAIDRDVAQLLNL